MKTVSIGEILLGDMPKPMLIKTNSQTGATTIEEVKGDDGHGQLTIE